MRPNRPSPAKPLPGPKPLRGPKPARQAGVFETTLVVDGVALFLDAHMERLETSVRELYGAPPPADARELAAQAAQGTESGRLRLTVAPDERGGLTADVRVADVDERLVFPGWDDAVELAPVAVTGGIGPHKWADRRLLERAEAELQPALPLIADADGSPLEASRGNLFLAEGDALVTPPADGRLLPGITRAQTIEAARALGIEVREQPVGPDALAGADEAFLTGAVRGIEPVKGCAELAEWSALGPITGQLVAELRRVWLG